MKNIKEHKQLKGTDIGKFRAMLLKKQNGKCPICRRVITDAVLDHSHTRRIKGSGLIRRVICRTCNVLLAKMENNAIRYKVSQEDLPFVLRSMAKYLELPHLPFIHPSERKKDPKLKKLSYNKLKKMYDGKAKLPEYPKTGKLTVKLDALFKQYEIEPEFYK